MSISIKIINLQGKTSEGFEAIKQTLFLATSAFLTGCEGSNLRTTISSGPATIAFAGLTYETYNGGFFQGLPKTTAAQMPTTGENSAIYSGVTRARVGEYLETGSATLDVNFDATTLTAQGNIDFKGAGGLGVLTYSGDAKITGAAFATETEDLVSNPESTTITRISGDFYNSDASVAAGTVSAPTAQSEILVGTFIVNRD